VRGTHEEGHWGDEFFHRTDGRQECSRRMMWAALPFGDVSGARPRINRSQAEVVWASPSLREPTVRFKLFRYVLASTDLTLAPPN
jgi:hypothetical protein